MDWNYAVKTLTLSLFLTACGGGGGGGGSEKPPEQPAPSITQYSISASADTGGSISPTSASINSGDALELTITLDEGYEIDQVSGCNGSLSDLVYTTGPITQNCEITVSFLEIIPDTVMPSVSVLFPGPVSLSGATNLTISGIASDDRSVASVRVNGLEALLTRPSKSSSSLSTEDSDHTDWSLSLPMETNALMSLNIEVEDEYGNIASAIRSTSIQSDQRRIPDNFEIDQATRKLIGKVDSRTFVTWGLDDGSYMESVSFNNNNCYATALKFDTSEFLCVSNNGHKISVYGKSLATGTERIIFDAEYPINQQEWPYLTVKDAQVSPDSSIVYILLRLNSADGDYYSMRSSLLALDLSSGSLTTTIDGTTGSPDVFASPEFSIVEDGFIAFSGIFDSSGLKKYSLDGKNVTTITESPIIYGQEITVDSANQYAYITGINGIEKVDLTTGEQVLLSSETKDQEIPVTQVYSVALDESTQRLIIGDGGYGYIYTVDINSGEKSGLIARSIGTGKHTYWPSALALDEPSNILYALDEGGNSSETLLAIDLQTGNRATMGHFDLDCFRSVRDLIHDPEGQRLIAVFSHAVFSVSTVDNQLTPLAGSTENACSQTSIHFGGASLDKANNRLFLTDLYSSSILALDLATRSITTLYSSPDLGGAIDIELNESTENLLIASKSLAKIIQFNPETKEHSVLVDSCQMSDGSDAFEEDYRGIEYMHLDAHSRRLWIMANVLVRYDLDSGTCTTMPFKGNGYGITTQDQIRDVALKATGELYGAGYNNVVQINFETGDMVTVSQ
ncbi:hypothetical protein [Microbulbifer sp. ALW1]|uniref:hypothetical protein n=1 Tax=Microbulbifer sp. (strain ALW1) TaxID=1516059 RepID=UPI00135C2CD5|nr:hypothetical protein [Microbulbifer sp. ALW1]